MANISENYLRGRQLISFEEARSAAEAIRHPEDPGVNWGGTLLPSDLATTHFCVVGTTGSGKTLLIRKLMESVLPRIGQSGKIHGRPVSMGPASRPETPEEKHWNGCFVTAFGVSAVLFAIAAPSSPAMLVVTLLIFILVMIGGFYIQNHLRKEADESFRQLHHEPPAEEDSQSAMRLEGHRALIYDAKQDVLSNLMSACSCPIKLLNPFDARASAWNIGKDVNTPITAQQIATVFIPENRAASQPFFSNAARDILGRVMIALMHLKPGEWELRDVMLAIRSQRTLHALLASNPHTRNVIEQYFGGGPNSQGSDQGRTEEPVFFLWGTASRNQSSSQQSGQSQGSSETINRKRSVRSSILASEFLALPPTNPRNGLTGYFIVPEIGAYKAHFSTQWLSQLKPPDHSTPNLVHRSARDQYLVEWSSDERHLIGLMIPGSQGEGSLTCEKALTNGKRELRPIGSAFDDVEGSMGVRSSSNASMPKLRRIENAFEET